MCEHHGNDRHHEAHRPHSEHVVLEIGGALGALVVFTGADLVHEEIEISPAGDDANRSHKDVLERRFNGSSSFAAVFDRLPAGTYTLWSAGEPRAREVTVDAGEVAQLDWRS